MFGKKQVFLSAILTQVLGGEPMESLFARGLADNNAWHYIGLKDGNYHFHDVFNDKPIVMSEEEVIKEYMASRNN